MKRITLVLAGCGLLITTPAFGQNLSERMDYVMQKRAQAEARNTSKAHMLSVLLYTDLPVQFDETPARDAFKYLETYLGINIVGRYSDDRTGEGIDPDAPITLDTTDQPALTVLEMILDQCADLDPTTWQLRNGFVEVGTKARLGAPGAREIRYYPIKDLLFEPPRFDNAPELDLDSALNQGFAGGGGGGRGGGGGGGGGFGGGGGSGGGGGGGGGRGGGGGIFGDPGDEADRRTELEKAQEVIDLILEIVEPDEWIENGGEAASIRYYQGTLIVRAPDYIQRQIGGYPFATRPVRRSVEAVIDRRYVTFTGAASNVQLAGFRETRAREFGGAAGGGTP